MGFRGGDGYEEFFRTVPEFENEKKVRLNCIHHLLRRVPYAEIEREPVVLPESVHNPDYLRHPVLRELSVPTVY